jgi:hypothetical protein
MGKTSRKSLNKKKTVLFSRHILQETECAIPQIWWSTTLIYESGFIFKKWESLNPEQPKEPSSGTIYTRSSRMRTEYSCSNKTK